MNIIKTKIEGLYIIEPKVFKDARGYFFESFSQRDFDEQIAIPLIGKPLIFVQDNESMSSYGVMRGLHFQRPPFTQSKIVRCVKGAVLDVAVDIRKGSPTYGQHVAVELTADNHRQFFISRGFAHGFAVLSETAVFQYKCDEFYHPEADDGISLVHQLGNSDAANAITEITDDNYGWAMTKQFPWSLFPSLRKIQVGCSTANMTQSYIQNDSVEEIEFSNLESITINAYNSGANNDFVRIGGIVKMPKLKTFVGQQGGTIGYPGSKVTKFIADEVESISVSYTPIFCNECYYLQEFIAPKLRTLTGGSWNEQRNLGNASSRTDDALVKVVVGYGSAFSHANYLMNHPNLIHVEIRQTADTNVNLAGWNPTNVLADQDLLQQFLQNFREYIALRLTDNGSGKTITLSQAVFSAVIEGASPICDEIKGIIEDKGWKVQDTNNNIFPTT